MCCSSFSHSSLFLNILQASEEGVHFIVSRQICLPAPDILQEAPWGMDGPPPYSPVDIEQTLLVRNTHRHTGGQKQNHYSELLSLRLLFMTNILFKVQMIPGRRCFPFKAEHVVPAGRRPLSQNHFVHISHHSLGFKVSFSSCRGRFLPLVMLKVHQRLCTAGSATCFLE